MGTKPSFSLEALTKIDKGIDEAAKERQERAIQKAEEPKPVVEIKPTTVKTEPIETQVEEEEPVVKKAKKRKVTKPVGRPKTKTEVQKTLTIKLDESLYNKFKEEADDITFGNMTNLLTLILRERYNLKK